MPEEKTHKILVLELWGIGDVVMMSAVLAPLRRAYPDAEISVLCQEHGREVLRENKEIGSFVCFTFPWTAFRHKYHFWTWDSRGLWRTLKALRQEKFDLLLDARGDPRNDLLAFLIGARRIVARSHGPRREHRVEHWKELLRRLDIPLVDLSPSITLTNEERAEAAAFLTQHFPEKPRTVIAVHPGARIITRRWPMERFREVLRGLRADGHDKVLVFVEPDGYGQELSQEKGVIPVQVSLRRMIVILSRVDVLICNDGGAMHLAAAVGARVVAVFGPTDPVVFAPYGAGHEIVVQDNVPCRPCFDRCRYKRPMCFDQITARDVLTALRRVLKEGRS